MITAKLAPGKPGAAPRWTTSQKSGVGTARTLNSHVWFAISQGILGEIFYPRIDQASVKDMGMLVTDGASFFSEEKRDTHSKVSWIKEGVPGFQVNNTCKTGRYTLQKTILTDSLRHVILQKTHFKPAPGSSTGLRLYVLLAPHLGDQGSDNTARVSDFKGIPMLTAEGAGLGLALACSAPWLMRSAGYVGVSDGWQDLHAHKHLTWQYQAAEDGNVALIGEIDLSAGGEFLLALGFGRNSDEAAHRAIASINEGFDSSRLVYEREWIDWQKSLRNLESGTKANSAAYRVGTAVLATHESKDFLGGVIASLSFPWGEIQGDKDKGGYHLVWPRDAYESASALLAAGATDEIIRALKFFETTQEAEGHWPQNMWLDGTQFWKNIQLDETAAPLLLLDLARQYGKVGSGELTRFWPMVRKAAGYILRNGPSTPEDRWEEDAGLTAYSLACMIAALLVAADIADENKESKLGAYFRETADAWNDAIERWTYVEGTDLARKVGVSGYYLRIAPPSRLSGQTTLSKEMLCIPNLSGGRVPFPAEEIVSVDALALVRFGLRAANDPRVINTVRVIDAILKVETPHGPCWHRYNHDGYGEHADGEPFDGSGIGRAWPLLVGERAHYELAAGNAKEAHRLCGVMEALAADTGLISEQVWDADPIPEKGLFPGRPSGSARPLVWAHAEHVKLLRSLADGKVFDMPPQAVKRYLTDKTRSHRTHWRFNQQIQQIMPGQILRIETAAAARVRWTSDEWSDHRDSDSHDTTVGLYVTDLPTKSLKHGTRIIFTFFWLEANHWEKKNFTVVVYSSEKKGEK